MDWDLTGGGAEIEGRGRAGGCTDGAVSASLFNLSGGEAATPTTIHILYITTYVSSVRKPCICLKVFYVNESNYIFVFLFNFMSCK